MTSYVNGYSVGSKDAIGVKSYKVKDGIVLPVRSSVAPLLIAAARDWDKLVEPLHPGWCWGYSFRQITGGTGYSWHAAGIAIDLNAPSHPYGVDGGHFTPAQHAMVIAIARKYGLRSGLEYHTNQDGMHLEVILSPAQAKKRIAELKANDRPVIPFHHNLKVGSKGEDVKALQRALVRRPLDFNPKADGVFGEQTRLAVNQFKKRNGMIPNGVIGRKAWNVLF